MVQVQYEFNLINVLFDIFFRSSWEYLYSILLLLPNQIYDSLAIVYG